MKGKHLEIIKEQVLDLNDKFDFLMTLFMKGSKLGANKVYKKGEEQHEFYIGEAQADSINAEHLDKANNDDILKAVKEF